MIAETRQRMTRHIPIRSETNLMRESIDQLRIEHAVREILLAVGEDPDRPGLLDTPQRVARAYKELLAGQESDPAEHLERIFPEDSDEMVLLRDISFTSLCEHHMLPVLGRAHVAYLPGDSGVVGLSKLARTVETYARRLQVQERMTNQIADALVSHLSPRGVLVVVEAEHMCMKMRGVKNHDGLMITSAARGLYKQDSCARAEVMSLIQQPRR